MPPTRVNKGCSIIFLKNVLHIFNIIFLAAGLGVLGIAVWTITDKYQYVSLLTTVVYPLLIYFLLTAGGLVLLTSIIGFTGVFKEIQPLLIFYVFFLVLIFLTEAMVGVIGFMYEEHVETELRMNLNTTFLTTYKIDEDKTAAIDFMQAEFKCCGAESFSDWEFSTWKQDNVDIPNKVPDSCCKTVTHKCGIRDHPSNINYSGCMDKMKQHMEMHLHILSAVGLGICVLQIFGIIFACVLYIKLKRESSEEENLLTH